MLTPLLAAATVYTDGRLSNSWFGIHPGNQPLFVPGRFPWTNLTQMEPGINPDLVSETGFNSCKYRHVEWDENSLNKSVNHVRARGPYEDFPE